MRHSLITFFLMLASTLMAQEEKMKITFNDGSEKTGMYKFRSPAGLFPQKIVIKSKLNNEKYHLKDVRKVTVYTDSIDLEYDVIDTKKYIYTKKSEKKLGMVAFRGKKITLHYVEEAIYQGGTIGPGSSGTYMNSFVRRTTDSTAFNMGYIYGAAQRGIKKRVREYFTDCPKLVEKVDDDSIKKEDIAAMVLFYEKNCGN